MLYCETICYIGSSTNAKCSAKFVYVNYHNYLNITSSIYRKFSDKITKTEKMKMTDIFLQQSVQSEANKSLFHASQVILEVVRSWTCRVTNKPVT